MSGGTSLTFAPLLPVLVLVPIFGLAALVALYGLACAARGGWWRLLTVAALCLALVNPSLITEVREPVKDVAVVVVDRSPSQALGARTARTERALAELETKLAPLPDLETRVVRSGGANLTETRLFEALAHAFADVPQQRRAGVILLTDGQVHDVPLDPGRSHDNGPVHVLLSGDHDEADRRLEIVKAPSFGLVGKPVALTFRIVDSPSDQSESAEVTIRHDDGTIHRLTVAVGREVSIDVPLEHGGRNIVELSVGSAPHELSLANNRVGVAINAVRDRLRVLLVSGEPYAGGRTWRNMLKADPAVDLVHFTILRPPEKQDGIPIRELSLIAFPIRELFEVKLAEFDLVIFDRYRQRGVLPMIYLDNIARYVRNGGALLEAGGGGGGFGDNLGLRGSSLGAVLPGQPVGPTIDRPFKPIVTAIGRRHPVTVGLAGSGAAGEEPSWGRWLHQSEVQIAHGRVLMTGFEDRPLLILDRVGEGRVAQLASDQIWLWSRGFEGGGPQVELLRRLAHWLMKEPDLEEDDLRARVEGNRIEIERRSLAPEPRSVELITPEGEVKTLAMADDGNGLLGAAITVEAPGIYRISDGLRHTVALVGEPGAPELADLRTTPERLQPVVDGSGGGVKWLVDIGSVDMGSGVMGSGGPQTSTGGLILRRPAANRIQSGPGWLGLRANGTYTVTGITDHPLLSPWALLPLVLGSMMMAWWREGK
ncbi:MAG: hypothetical protein WCK65_05610 [Rhodospirillaceae bacterium]